VILPAAALVQLVKIIISKDVGGISLITWLLFGLANIGLYIFTEKYFYVQSLLGLLFTALLDFIIVGFVLYFKSIKAR
jgi:hypothetical protein